MDVSVVIGIYNRFLFFKWMVGSVRKFYVGVFLFEVEYVVVDGGSEDGMLEWCCV